MQRFIKAMSMRAGALSACLLVAGLGSLAGCQALAGQKPGGRMVSWDQFTYESTAHQPQTVKLIDLRDQQELWSVDVPVGYKLVVKFYDSPNSGDAYMTDEMRWAVLPAKSGPRTLGSQIPVPPHWARRLDVELRDSPEASPDAPAGRVVTGA